MKVQIKGALANAPYGILIYFVWGGIHSHIQGGNEFVGDINESIIF
jgi:membrane protein insertase Oxa1/YidC/SpoIIIJ